MAEKKRKGTDSSAAQPTKKSKKNVKIASEPVVVAEETTTVVEPATIEDASAKPSKRTRKRAADFLYDAPEDDSPKPKKGKKDAKVADEPKSLTADGTNGVVEHSDNEDITITTTKQPKKKSMMAEAERTQDAELAEEYGSDKDESEEDIDTAPALLTGFDSDNEDAAEDKNFDASKLGAIPQFKKTSKKLRKAAESKNDGPGVVYIGRIPHGFYESQMKEYFSQFGTIARLRLSRNKKTGASKHFAFIEFESNEVAKIVADTMDNYLMFGHILKCKYAPAENLHADVWKGANRKYRKIPQHKLLKQKAEQPKTEEQIDKKMKKVQSKREKKLKQLTEMGYEYELPTLVKPTVQVQAAEEKPEPLAIEDKVEGAVIPPSNVPKDEVAVMVEEKQKKAKKEKSKKQQAKTSEETAPAAAEEAPVATEAPKKTGKKGKKDAAAVEPVPVATEEVVAVEEPKRSKRNKKETATEAAPAVIEEVAVEVAKPAKKGKKGKKDEAIVEVVPVVTEETAVVAEEPAPKKGRKAKKEVVVEATPVVVEQATTITEEAPKASKKSKKDVEVKGDGKQLKSILKKTKKA